MEGKLKLYIRNRFAVIVCDDNHSYVSKQITMCSSALRQMACLDIPQATSNDLQY